MTKAPINELVGRRDLGKSALRPIHEGREGYVAVGVRKRIAARPDMKDDVSDFVENPQVVESIGQQ